MWCIRFQLHHKSGRNMKNKIACVVSGALVLSMLLTGCGSKKEEFPSRSEISQGAIEENQNLADIESTAEPSQEEFDFETEETLVQAESGESIVTNGGEVIDIAALEHQNSDGETLVYYTSEISAQAMVDLYEALGAGLTGEHIAVKLSTGEPPASNYLDPELIADLVHQIDGTIVKIIRHTVDSVPVQPCTTR